jgi:hypothetical protein
MCQDYQSAERSSCSFLKFSTDIADKQAEELLQADRSEPQMVLIADCSRNLDRSNLWDDWRARSLHAARGLY